MSKVKNSCLNNKIVRISFSFFTRNSGRIFNNLIIISPAKAGFFIYEEKILEIKAGPTSSEIIGSQSKGGLINIDSKQYWLRHPKWRWYKNQGWGRENAVSPKTTSRRMCFQLELSPAQVTRRLAEEQLTILKGNDLPEYWSWGRNRRWLI
jgi:hypothetical protein